MSKVTTNMGMSLDGFTSGPNPGLEYPFGEGGGVRLKEWMERWMSDAPEDVEAITAARAFVMGRAMFTPGTGAWDPDWTGWWGEDPPYHAPVFVLTHQPREPVTMKGGTTFTFVTDGIESALAQAREAAGDGDVSITGGARTVNQYLAAGLVDEVRLYVAPMVIGAGQRLFDGVGSLALEQIEVSHAPGVTHLRYRVVR